MPHKKMNIKERLRLSNVLMLLIPIVVAVLMGLASIGIFFAVLNGNGGLALGERRFYTSKEAIVSLIGESLDDAEQERSLDKLMDNVDSSRMRLYIMKDGVTFYDRGEEHETDSDMIYRTIQDDEIFLSDSTRQLYRKKLTVRDGVYDIFIFSDDAKINYFHLKITIVILACAFIILVVISVFLSNHFLLRFVFKDIDDPLDRLLIAAKEVSEGNLDYRIEFDKENEFRPVIDEFNAMTIQLKQSLEQIKQNDEDRKLLVIGITHDIKSPLTSVLGYAEGLLDGVADTKERQEKYLRGIKRKCMEIDELVGKMIVLTKNPNSMNLEGQDMDVNEAVEAFVREMGPEYSQNGLDIYIDLHCRLTISCQKDDFRRILVNLADNSLKYRKGSKGQLGIILKKRRMKFFWNLKMTESVSKRMRFTISLILFIVEMQQGHRRRADTDLGLPSSKKSFFPLTEKYML